MEVAHPNERGASETAQRLRGISKVIPLGSRAAITPTSTRTGIRFVTLIVLACKPELRRCPFLDDGRRRAGSSPGLRSGRYSILDQWEQAPISFQMDPTFTRTGKKPDSAHPARLRRAKKAGFQRTRFLEGRQSRAHKMYLAALHMFHRIG